LTVLVPHQNNLGSYCNTTSTIVVCKAGYCAAGSTSQQLSGRLILPTWSPSQQPCPGGSYCVNTSTIDTCPASHYCPLNSTTPSSYATSQMSPAGSMKISQCTFYCPVDVSCASWQGTSPCSQNLFGPAPQIPSYTLLDVMHSCRQFKNATCSLSILAG
jgi:hypothetical protein